MWMFIIPLIVIIIKEFIILYPLNILRLQNNILIVKEELIIKSLYIPCSVSA